MDQKDFEILRVYLQILIDGPTWKKPAAENTAILILPGMWQEYRITNGVKLWPQHGKHLWVAGTRQDTIYTLREQLVSLLGQDSENIEFGGFADHTLGQMQWCLGLLEKYSTVNHIIVATAAYHVPRCTLTLLQTLAKANKQLSLSPWPLYNPAGNSFTEDENFQGELERIALYQEKGDVASLQTWRTYLAWRLRSFVKE